MPESAGGMHAVILARGVSFLVEAVFSAARVVILARGVSFLAEVVFSAARCACHTWRRLSSLYHSSAESVILGECHSWRRPSSLRRGLSSWRGECHSWRRLSSLRRDARVILGGGISQVPGLAIGPLGSSVPPRRRRVSALIGIVVRRYMEPNAKHSHL